VQLAIFVCGVDEYFKTMEELATLVPLKNTTKAADLYTALQNTLKTCQLKINNMSAPHTDGASVMLGKNEGVVATAK
jgi:hypothetical protein